LVWQDSEVGEFANAKFVNLRVTNTDSDYSEWRTKFNTPGTPTVVFLDAEGNEIDRFVGFGGEDAKEETFQMLKDFAAGINTLPAILAELEESPEDVEINYKLAKKYLSRYEVPKAVPLFEKVLELDPENTKGYGEEANYRIALQTAGTQQDPSALEAFIDSNPGNQEYLQTAYTTVASTYARKKELDKACDVYEKAMEALPDNARIILSYAGAIFNYKMEDLYEKGLELNERAKALNPDYELSTALNLVTYYGNTDQKDKVVELLDETIKNNEALKGFYASTIVRMEIADKYDFAIEMMQEEVSKEENAKSAHLWLTLGQIYEKKGDLQNALTNIKKATELSPGAAYYKNELERIEKEIEKK
jgi:pentatricopeptide repeat protein